jgi:biotin synthase
MLNESSRSNITAKLEAHEGGESPQYVRTSLAAAMTMGLIPGKFFHNTKLYCINLLLTYNEGCFGRCAYCGLSRARLTDNPWRDNSFIRVDWPTVALDEIISRINGGHCPHVERVCISMITNSKTRRDLITVVKRLSETVDRISALITPTIVDKKWLHELKMAGADMVGIAIDAATPELFEKLRGQSVMGNHKWRKYWKTLEEAVEIFGDDNVGIHLIVGLGESEADMVNIIQQAQKMGAKTHLFSFYPEEESSMQNHPQPPIGQYRRIQLARYLINHNLTSLARMEFNDTGQISDYGLNKKSLFNIINSGLPFLTSGCRGKTMENACNRPFGNCTPYQAYIGELRNYPFQPEKKDIKTIHKQLNDFSEKSKNPQDLTTPIDE